MRVAGVAPGDEFSVDVETADALVQVEELGRRDAALPQPEQAVLEGHVGGWAARKRRRRSPAKRGLVDILDGAARTAQVGQRVVDQRLVEQSAVTARAAAGDD